MPCSPGPAEEMVTLQPVIRTMDESDPETISAAFHHPRVTYEAALYQRYLAERDRMTAARLRRRMARQVAPGYVTLFVGFGLRSVR